MHTPSRFGCQLGAVGGAFTTLAAAFIAFGILAESAAVFAVGGLAYLLGALLLGVGWLLVRRDARDVIAGIGALATLGLVLGPQPVLGLVAFSLGHAFVRGVTGLRAPAIVSACALTVGMIIGVGPDTDVFVRTVLFNAHTLALGTIGLATARGLLAYVPVWAKRYASGSTSWPTIAMAS